MVIEYGRNQSETSSPLHLRRLVATSLATLLAPLTISACTSRSTEAAPTVIAPEMQVAMDSVAQGKGPIVLPSDTPCPHGIEVAPNIEVFVTWGTEIYSVNPDTRIGPVYCEDGFIDASNQRGTLVFSAEL